MVTQFIEKLRKSQIAIEGSRVLIMGLTFKENCPDLRNTQVVNIIDQLKRKM